MTMLSERDVRSTLDFVYDATSITSSDPFPRELLERLAQLIPADAIVGYHEAIIGRPCRVVESVETPGGGNPSRPAGGWRAFSRAGSDQARLHCRELRALKFSDFLTRRERRNSSSTGMSGAARTTTVCESAARACGAGPCDLPGARQAQTSPSVSILLELLRPSLIRVQAAASARRHRNEGAASALYIVVAQRSLVGSRGKTSRDIAPTSSCRRTPCASTLSTFSRSWASQREVRQWRAYPAPALREELDRRLDR